MGVQARVRTAMKPTNPTETAADGLLSYQDCLPLAWLPQPVSEPNPQVQALCGGNAQVLAAVLAVEEHGGRSGTPDEETPIDREVARLHRKLDLLVEMVGSLLSAQTARPSAIPLELSSRELKWLGANPPQAGEGVIEIHLHRSVAHPLRLAAQSLGGGRIAFLPMDETTAAALETHVFLHHRRSVAEARLSQRR